MSKLKAQGRRVRTGEIRKRGKNVSAPKPAAKAKVVEAALPALPASMKSMAHAMKGLAPVIKSVANLRQTLPRFFESQFRFMLAGQRAREMVSMCQQDASLNEVLGKARSYLQSVGGADDDLACWLLCYAVGKGGVLQEKVDEAVRELQSNAGKTPKRSAGIVAAIKQQLQDRGGSTQSAEQVWRKLLLYQEEAPYKADGYSVFMDAEYGAIKLRSLCSDGSPDGRPLVRTSFNRVFSDVKKGMQ